MRLAARTIVVFAALAWLLCGGRAARAQERVTLESVVLLYGDNTEFRNPYREGETIFGAAARVAVDVELKPGVSLALGGFGNQRFGSDHAFEQARPVIALTLAGTHSTFVFGTLPAMRADGPMGPDRGGRHTLLPPLQRETLAFDRPYEAGLQWDLRTARFRHRLWIEWQRLNTAEHRERFDGGLDAELTLSRHLAMPVQMHVVHEGGQLFNAGPVDDSAAGAAGIRLHGRSPRLGQLSIEVFAAAARSVPDRQHRELDRSGPGFFARGAIERGGWRGHLIVWRARNFIKDEGDPNYLSLKRSGARYGGTRDYAETGLAKRFRLTPDAVIELSGRLHRTESYYEYSYRIVSIVNMRWKLR
jgi:hypothetical protein